MIISITEKFWKWKVVTERVENAEIRSPRRGLEGWDMLGREFNSEFYMSVTVGLAGSSNPGIGEQTKGWIRKTLPVQGTLILS